MTTASPYILRLLKHGGILLLRVFGILGTTAVGAAAAVASGAGSHDDAGSDVQLDTPEITDVGNLNWQMNYGNSDDR